MPLTSAPAAAVPSRPGLRRLASLPERERPAPPASVPAPAAFAHDLPAAAAAAAGGPSLAASGEPAAPWQVPASPLRPAVRRDPVFVENEAAIVRRINTRFDLAVRNAQRFAPTPTTPLAEPESGNGGG